MHGLYKIFLCTFFFQKFIKIVSIFSKGQTGTESKEMLKMKVTMDASENHFLSVIVNESHMTSCYLNSFNI